MTIRRRLTALAGLVAIVGVVIGALVVAGLVGNQGGGEGIEKVELPETPVPEGLDVGVGAEAGKLAPDFVLSDFDGVRHRLSDFRGEVVYVNFWATWCVPCGVELPDIYSLEQEHAGDVAVIAVNRSQSLETAQDWLEGIPRKDGGKGVSFTVNGMDPDDTLYREYRGLGMPVSYFIDADGVITRVYNGLIDRDTMEESINEALAAGSSARLP